jgi:hypothetical protein
VAGNGGSELLKSSNPTGTPGPARYATSQTQLAPAITAHRSTARRNSGIGSCTEVACHESVLGLAPRKGRRQPSSPSSPNRTVPRSSSDLKTPCAASTAATIATSTTQQDTLNDGPIPADKEAPTISVKGPQWRARRARNGFADYSSRSAQISVVGPLLLTKVKLPAASTV